MPGFVTGGVLLLYVYNRYLYDRFLRRETDGNRLMWFPLFMSKHPGAVLLSFAILMFLMSLVLIYASVVSELPWVTFPGRAAGYPTAAG